MKKIISLSVLVICFFCQTTLAQSNANSLPEITTITPYQLQVGYNMTTVIIFPAAIIAGDRGYSEIIVTKEKEVSNILKVKGSKRNFEPTNLHVYTIDGKVYAFNISYVDYPNRLTFNLNNLTNPINSSPLLFANTLVNTTELEKTAAQVREQVPFFSRATTQYLAKLQLQGIHLVNNYMFFSFALSNHSNLPYEIDFIRLYIHDKQKKKRSSVQEREIIPVYKDNFQIVEAEGEYKFTVAVPKFTIPDKKQFVIELYEKGGGRNISLTVKNRHLLNARLLQ
jgi:conjugative transposon TraN protein